MKARAVLLFAVPALVLSAGGHHRRSALLNEKGAKSIAARETGGQAVSAHEIPLNGASGGWEVDVHMPKESQGWRCVIDDDSRMVVTKTRIPNPTTPTRKSK